MCSYDCKYEIIFTAKSLIWMEYTKVSIKWAQFQIKLKDLCYRGAFVTRKENKRTVKYSGELTHM